MTKIQDLQLNNTFINNLPQDKENENYSRQVYKAAYSFVEPQKFENPSLIIVSDEMLKELAIDDANSIQFLKVVAGQETIRNAKPYAMCYGGHQFGQWAGQLGDGRAINIAQVKAKNKTWTLQLKGAGPTPYSRGADGFAVLRSSIREFLCSEAMYHLGVSTTRALSLALTGEKVMRDMLYDGNPAYEPGAIVCRAAESFIRFGNFEIFSARKDKVNLKKLVDYTIENYFETIKGNDKEKYLAFFKEVTLRTADLIIDWQRVGFVHGVMNTDNMSILGQTIDYGPYGWMENLDFNWTPNTTDAQTKRYCFGNQGNVALWNLIQLANALFPLINDVKALEKTLDEYKNYYVINYHKMLNKKIGLTTWQQSDKQLQEDLLNLLEENQIDMTIFYRNLSQFDSNKLEKHIELIKEASYLEEINVNQFKLWLNEYSNRLHEEGVSFEERKSNMNSYNPKYVLRNYMAQLAIENAEKKDYKLINELNSLLKKPYDEQKYMEKWFVKRPDWALNKPGSSQLSCSS